MPRVYIVPGVTLSISVSKYPDHHKMQCLSRRESQHLYRKLSSRCTAASLCFCNTISLWALQEEFQFWATVRVWWVMLASPDPRGDKAWSLIIPPQHLGGFTAPRLVMAWLGPLLCPDTISLISWCPSWLLSCVITTWWHLRSWISQFRLWSCPGPCFQD